MKSLLLTSFQEEVYELTEGNETNSLEHLNKRVPPSMTARSNLDAAMEVLFSFITVNCKETESASKASDQAKNKNEVNQKQSVFKQTIKSILKVSPLASRAALLQVSLYFVLY